jgi:hypothetical protein
MSFDPAFHQRFSYCIISTPSVSGVGMARTHVRQLTRATRLRQLPEWDVGRVGSRVDTHPDVLAVLVSSPSVRGPESGHHVQTESAGGRIPADRRDGWPIGSRIADVEQPAALGFGHDHLDRRSAMPKAVGGELFEREQQPLDWVLPAVTSRQADVQPGSQLTAQLRQVTQCGRCRPPHDRPRHAGIRHRPLDPQGLAHAPLSPGPSTDAARDGVQAHPPDDAHARDRWRLSCIAPRPADDSRPPPFAGIRDAASTPMGGPPTRAVESQRIAPDPRQFRCLRRHRRGRALSAALTNSVEEGLQPAIPPVSFGRPAENILTASGRSTMTRTPARRPLRVASCRITPARGSS